MLPGQPSASNVVNAYLVITGPIDLIRVLCCGDDGADVDLSQHKPGF